jgi:uncharacterized protein YecT (DUF1311 family)
LDTAHAGIDSPFALEDTSFAMINVKRVFACLCLLILFPPSSRLFGEEEQGCLKLQSTAEKAECFGQKLRVAESEMNRAFHHALSAHLPHNETEKELPTLPKKDAQFAREQDRLTVRALRASQVRWLSYRESSCSAVEHTYEEASITAEAVPACKVELTQQRPAWLNSYFQR